MTCAVAYLGHLVASRGTERVSSFTHLCAFGFTKFYNKSLFYYLISFCVNYVFALCHYLRGYVRLITIARQFTCESSAHDMFYYLCRHQLLVEANWCLVFLILQIVFDAENIAVGTNARI